MDFTSDPEDFHSISSHPSPQDFVTFLPHTCFQLEAPFRLKINVQTQGEYHNLDKRKTKTRRMIAQQHAPTPASDDFQPESDITSPQYFDDTQVTVTAITDTQGRLVELMFNRCAEIPRLLIKVIGFCVPYHQHLYRITVRWGPLTTAGLYEFSKFLAISQLSEIILDDSPVAGRNYEVLLDQPSQLRCLSLSRCKLDDDDCVKLAALLVHPRAASRTLAVLSLVSNRIGDRGACGLGNALRTNRVLKYLNLAGNCITDVGAICILKSLMEFQISFVEIVDKRYRCLEYLKRRNEVYARYLKELHDDRFQDEARLSRRRTNMRQQRTISIAAGLSTADAVKQKADIMTTELIGSFNDPFSNDQIMRRQGLMYCCGNLVLSCLNLAFNNLEYATILTLYDVLVHQSWMAPKATTGLLRINIEGNNLPVECDEWMLIDELLERAQVAKAKHVRRPSERVKSRASKMF